MMFAVDPRNQGDFGQDLPDHLRKAGGFWTNHPATWHRVSIRTPCGTAVAQLSQESKPAARWLVVCFSLHDLPCGTSRTYKPTFFSTSTRSPIEKEQTASWQRIYRGGMGGDARSMVALKTKSPFTVQPVCMVFLFRASY